MSTIQRESFAYRHVTPGVYKHFKNEDHFYKVFGVCNNTETNAYLVVYSAMYGPHQGYLAVRDLDMFLEEVEVNGKKIPRFTLIKEQSFIENIKHDRQ